MHEPSGDFAEVEYVHPDTLVVMSLDDARTIARAFQMLNQRMAGDLSAILNSEQPQHLVEAAVERYNLDVKNMTELHVQLALIFPQLSQTPGAGVAG